MNNILEKLRKIHPKEVISGALRIAENHTLTLLIMFAGLLVGLSLLSVNNLTKNSTGNQMGNEAITPDTNINSLGLNKETTDLLLTLNEDTDVTIGSNIASYRRSAFSSATDESKWVIGAADVLEKLESEANFYPTTKAVAEILRDNAYSPADPAGRTVNTEGSDYTYVGENCGDNSRCKAFTLSAKVGSSIYQMGETDATKRTWVDATAEALVAYQKTSSEKLYPLESSFVAELKLYYEKTFSTEFVDADPAGGKVNKDNSDYVYRGVNCGTSGCQSFVLRTTFKDGALYFQQSQ
jgi:hypothetical protein